MSEDWDKEYQVVLTGKTLEAMRFLSRWVLDNANAGEMGKYKSPSGQVLLPFSVIAACDHLFSLASKVRTDAEREG
jgi:hypothetical protein